MNTKRQFAMAFVLILAVLSPLVVPTMVCALPNAHLSQAERACCRQMGKNRCASSATPKCESCCQKEVPTARNWKATVQARSADVQMSMNAIGGWVSLPLALPPVNPIDHSQRVGIPLPKSPPSAISVLRI